MGYTHYWRFGYKDKDKYNEALEDIRKIIAKSPVPLAGWDGTGKPDLEGKVVFNGSGEEDSHETFSLNPETDESFNFCKTAQKAYDIVVVACLCILQEKLGDGVSVSSDGDAEEWEDGRELASKILGRTVQTPEKIRVK